MSFHMVQTLGRSIGIGLALVGLALACGRPAAGSIATSAPAPTDTAVSVPPTPSPPAPRSTPRLTATATRQLETLTLIYSGALSIEDLNTLMLDLRALPGISDVQGGLQDLEVTYDPAQISPQAIIDTIISHGYRVENPG